MYRFPSLLSHRLRFLCHFLSVLLAGAASWLMGCTDDVLPPYHPELVVEGWIEEGGFPIVIVTQTIPLNGEYKDKASLADHIIQWATVSVSDGQDTVVLTGKVDKGYFPPFIYTTSKMRGERGKTYHLKVEYADFCATAVTRIPPPPAVEQFVVEPVPDLDTLYRVRALLNDPPAEKNYYQLFCRTGGHSRQFLAAYLGSIDDAILDGPAWLNISRGHQLGIIQQYTPYFFHGDTVSVKVAQITEEAYHFWDSYTKIVAEGNNLMWSSFKSLPSNITGGKGYWSGMGSVTDYFVISR